MGSCYSHIVEFKVSDVEGQDDNALALFRVLEIDQENLNIMFTAFREIDADDSGTIKPAEFFHFCEIEPGDLEIHIFSLFDIDHSGVLNFMEFVASCWYFMTLPETEYCNLIFLLNRPPSIESTENESLQLTEIEELLKFLQPTAYSKPNSEIQLKFQQLFSFTRSMGNYYLTKKEFFEWFLKNADIGNPIKRLQLHLQSKIIGVPFWNRMMETRKKNPEKFNGEYATVLISELNQKKLEYQSAMGSETRKKETQRRRGMRDSFVRSVDAVRMSFILNKHQSPVKYNHSNTHAPMRRNKVVVTNNNNNHNNQEDGGGGGGTSSSNEENNNNHHHPHNQLEGVVKSKGVSQLNANIYKQPPAPSLNQHHQQKREKEKEKSNSSSKKTEGGAGSGGGGKEESGGDKKSNSINKNQTPIRPRRSIFKPNLVRKPKTETTKGKT